MAKSKLSTMNKKYAVKKDSRTKAAIAADKDRKAKHPGKRTSASGKTYFESRPNRSDVNRTKKFDDGGKVTDERIDDILHHYMVAALWSSTDVDNEENLDANYSVDDIDPESKSKMRQIVSDFVNENYADIEESELTDEQVGHSLWLSHNGHGAGFFDYGTEAADRLDKAAGKIKSIDLYVSDDKKVTFAKGGRTKAAIAADKDRKAMHPGKRTSASGKTYFESRPNRSDVNRTKRFAGGGTLRPNENPWFGTDASLEESLHEYGFVMRKAVGKDMAEDEYQVLYRLKDNVYDVSYITEKGMDAIVKGEEWASEDDARSMLNTTGTSDVDEWIGLPVQHKLSDLLSYWGYENIFGSSYGQTWTKAEANREIGVEDEDDDLIEFIIPTWAMSALVNGDESGLTDEEQVKLNKFVDETVEKYGNANFLLTDEGSYFNWRNDIDGNLGADVEKMNLRPSKAYKKGGRTKAAIAADKDRKAMHPGKRTSASGKTYFESRPNRSDVNRTKKFAEGGKPLGSTGLFAKGGITRDSMSKVSARVPGNEEFKEGAIIIGVTKSGEILIANVFNGRYGGNKTPHFSVSGDTVQPYTLSAAKKYAKQFWIDLFEQDPDMLEDMNARMGRNFSSPSSAAQYVLDVDGELHGFDTYSKFGERSLLGKEYVFQHTGAGQNRDDFDNLSVKYVPDSYLNELLRLWDTYHLKELPASESIPFLSQDEDAILADAIKVISKRNFADGGTVAEYNFEDWSKYNDQDLAHDIELFAENDSDLYRQSYVPIVKNLKKKLDKGTFDVKLAAKLWMYYVQSADKKYQKDVNGTTPKGFLLSVNDRKLLAERLAESILNEYNINKLDGFAKGGEVLEEDDINHLFAKVTTSGETMLDEFIDDNNGFGYESYYNKNTGEVEHKSVSGFIPFTNGGVSSTWFEYIDSLIGMGKRLPTNTLQANIEKMDNDAHEIAKEKFMEQYPDIVEKLGEEKINYHDLHEEGYGEQAEQLDEWRRDYIEEETAMMQVGFYLYKPTNSNSVDGMPTCYVFGLVNLEAPYHREGNLEDYVEETFTFHNEQGFKNKLAKSLEKVKNWFEGGSYDQGRPLSIRRMKDGGSVTDTSVQYADLPGDQFAKGGVARIANSEAKEHTENLIDFKGNNLEGKTLDNGDYVVLSYGYYPIWYYNKSEQKWYGNSTKYSVTTSKQMTQSRPTYDPVMLEHNQLLSKMQEENAKFDLGGAMIDVMYPMTLDNTTAAHAGSAIETQQQM